MFLTTHFMGSFVVHVLCVKLENAAGIDDAKWGVIRAKVRLNVVKLAFTGSISAR